MSEKNTTIDPRYLSYKNKDVIQALLDEVRDSSTATEQSVRSIVINYQH